MKMNYLFLTVATTSLLFFSCGTDTSDDTITDDSTTIDAEISEINEEENNTVTTSSLYEGDGFAIAFPETPLRETETIPTEVGDIQLVTYMYEPSVTKVYMVAYSDYPSLLVSLSDDETLLEGGKNGALGSLGIYNLDEETNIELDGNKGIWLKGYNDDNFYVEYEMYMKDNRLYQIAIMQDGAYPSLPEDEAFFSSFEFTE